MAKVVSGNVFSEDDQSTHTAHNLAWSASTFDSSAVDDSTIALNGSGAMSLKAGGVLTTHIADGNVTLGKMGANSVATNQLITGSVDNDALAPASGTAAVAGSGTGASGTNVIEAASIGFADLNSDVITGQTELVATAEQTDSVLVSDDSDSGALKEISLKWLLVPRAWGRIDFTTSGATTVLGGYNVSATCVDSGVYSGSYQMKTITFANITFADTNYVVTVSWGGSAVTGSSTPSVITLTRATTTLKIAALVQTAAYVDFVVHGALA